MGATLRTRTRERIHQRDLRLLRVMSSSTPEGKRGGVGAVGKGFKETTTRMLAGPCYAKRWSNRDGTTMGVSRAILGVIVVAENADGCSPISTPRSP